MHGTANRASNSKVTAMNKYFDHVFTLFLAVLFAAVIVNSLSFPPRARSIPLIIGIPGLALCLWEIAAIHIRLKKERALQSTKVRSGGEDFQLSKFIINIFVLPLSLFLMAYFLGFIVAAPVFVFC